ncbi:antibiotic biosynthesis monooxygenase [Parasphingorhabdus sp.]|uniref:antibiotic biosynthesis monooxygenase n=1 Tax=Parasphingorhabdus sp. TaxID=2709688 RepID=UPI003264F49D
MNYVLIIHEVEDYAVWKKGFDQARDLRKSAGEIEYQILRYEDDPNRIVHFSKWHSLDQAKGFFESDKVNAIRNELGVKAPDFIYLDALESGIL